VVDCWATTPYPLLLRRRGAIFMAAKNLGIFKINEHWRSFLRFTQDRLQLPRMTVEELLSILLSPAVRLHERV